MTAAALSPTATMKYKGKVPLSIVALVASGIAFLVLFNTESLSLLPKSKEEVDINDGVKFDCNVANGKWVFNGSVNPLYNDTSCPYIDRTFSCVKNGRPDSDYRHWQWQPDECTLPQFDPKRVLEKLRGKRMLFIGDSLQRGQWVSFVCMIEWLIPQDQKTTDPDLHHSVFKAKEYDATIEFFWAPYLVDSNSDLEILPAEDRIIRVDSVKNNSMNWGRADFLVFNTYVWWTNQGTQKTLWGSFANGPEGYEELDAQVAYRIGLKTWANWIDSNLNSKRTRVFFITMSPTHMRSADWGNVNGTKCYNETMPVMKKEYWGTGSNKKMMSAVASVVGRMKFPVTLINITQLSEYRIDAHASVYTEAGGVLLTEEQQAVPTNADCIHWCLPGVPDTWNQILAASL